MLTVYMDNQTTQPIVTQPQSQQLTSQPPNSKSKLKPLLFSLLALIVLAAVGYGVYSWQHKKVSDADTKVSSLQSQLSSLQDQVNKLSQATKSLSTSNASSTQSSDPTAAWTSFTSADGKFSLKYPSSWVLAAANCTGPNSFGVGPTSSSAGSCNANGVGDNTPQITVVDTEHPCGELSSSITDVSVDGGSGYVSSATASDGTKSTEYCIKSPSNQDLEYEVTYTQSPGYSDVSSDFTTIVTKTLTFK